MPDHPEAPHLKPRNVDFERLNPAAEPDHHPLRLFHFG